jgi:hypothetical protein
MGYKSHTLLAYFLQVSPFFLFFSRRERATRPNRVFSVLTDA